MCTTGSIPVTAITSFHYPVYRAHYPILGSFYMARYNLPKIGDGTGGTVTLAAFAADLTAFVGTGTNALETTELFDARGQRIAIIPAKARKLFVVADGAGRQFWTTSDDPNKLGSADAPDWPLGGGGPHKLTHQHLGTDEIDISALSGLLADPQAPLSHTHIIADTTGLQTVLDGKASVVHSHSISDVTLLQIALDAKAPLVHTHAIADTTGLQAALDAKAALVHTHAQADVTGLVVALAGKSDVGHTHAAADVVSGVLATARLGSGIADSTKFLRGDQLWAVPAGGSTPTGTGFRHIAAGVEDAAAKLVDTADINDGQVTHAKRANIATARLLGRVTAGAGVIEELTAAQVITMLALFIPFLRVLTGNVTLVANESRSVVGPYDIGTFIVDIAAGAALEIT